MSNAPSIHVTEHVAPMHLQLDPGLKDWRQYTLSWYGSRTLAEIVATRTAGAGYAAGTEYWYVDRSMLTDASELVISSADHEWGDPLPSAFADTQEFSSPCSSTWSLVATDLTTGILYKHATKDQYLRIAIVASPVKNISKLRWYQAAATAPSSPFDPSGSYTEVSALGVGTIYYADSM